MKSLLSFQNAVTNNFLIVGLGNPGQAYEKSRHNVGFRALNFFAKRHSITFKRNNKVLGEIGNGVIGAYKAYTLFPMTYMNNSGEAVCRSSKELKVKSDQVAVVVDDIALSVGDIRFKERGSAGGHNGLKSIEHYLGTQNYPRIRIGIGHPEGRDLADFVLSNFSYEEEQQLPEVFNHVANVIDCWILQGIQSAMCLANTNKS